MFLIFQYMKGQTHRAAVAFLAFGALLGGVGWTYASAKTVATDELLSNIVADTSYDNTQEQPRKDTALLAQAHEPICTWLHTLADAGHVTDTGITAEALREDDVRAVFVGAFGSDAQADWTITKLTELMGAGDDNEGV